MSNSTVQPDCVSDLACQLYQDIRGTILTRDPRERREVVFLLLSLLRSSPWCIKAGLWLYNKQSCAVAISS